MFPPSDDKQVFPPTSRFKGRTPKEILWSKIKDSNIAMMTSISRDTELHSRPMMMAQTSFDGTLFFFSRLSSEKIDQITHNENILLTYTDPKDVTFVSVYGQARISRNPAKIREHWLPALETYFDRSMNDPDLCLIEVDVKAADCWNSEKSKMSRIFEFFEAPHRPSPGFGEHQFLKM